MTKLVEEPLRPLDGNRHESSLCCVYHVGFVLFATEKSKWCQSVLVADLPPGESIRIIVADVPIALFHVEDDAGGGFLRHRRHLHAPGTPRWPTAGWRAVRSNGPLARGLFSICAPAEPSGPPADQARCGPTRWTVEDGMVFVLGRRPGRGLRWTRSAIVGRLAGRDCRPARIAA